MKFRVLAAIPALVLAVGCGSSFGGGTTSVDSPAATDAPLSGNIAPSGAAAATDGASAAAAPASPVILLSIAGDGDNQTASFTASGDWNLGYTYNCADFGQSGNFAVSVYDKDGTPDFSNDGPNTIGTNGTGVSHEHTGGTFYLSVLSECKWLIVVTTAP